MAKFQHGTSYKEMPSGLKIFAETQTPTVIVGTGTINMGDMSCVNKPILIQNSKDAATYFGGANNIKGFTINEALYLAFNVYNVKPIIVINVLNPSEHKTAHTEQDIVVKDFKATLEKIGIINDENLIIKNGETSTLIAKEKYSCSFDNEGKLIITLAKTETSVKKLEVSYNFLDVSKLKETDVIGSIDPQTLEAKGLECLKEIFPKYSMIPSCVVAPDFSTAKIRVALDAKSAVINDKWASMSIPEMPNTTKYGEVIAFKKEKNYIDADQAITWGCPYLEDEVFNFSTVMALHMQSVDAQFDGVPCESPSNKNIKMQGVGYYEGATFKKVNLDEAEANLLNENGISTIIRQPNGTVFWGNRTSVFQPGGETDPKDVWIPVKRMFKYIGNTIMLNNTVEVDKGMTPSQAKSIETNINVWLNSLTNDNKLLGGRVEFKPEENSEQDMIAGKFKWHIYLGAIIPGESLEFRLEYDSKYLKLLFQR